MVVRKTESRIPEGFKPEDLGQAVVSGDYALVSYLTSPIAQGMPADYVVFALNNAADAYHWTIESIPSGIKEESPSEVGIYQYTPKHLGTLTVKVEVKVGKETKILELNQDVVPLDSDLERLLCGFRWLWESFNLTRNFGAFGGHDETSRELVNNFKNYILQASLLPLVGNFDIPPIFLAAVVYLEILRVPTSERSQWLEILAVDLNDLAPTSVRELINNSLGVCQIKPQTLAMILNKPSSLETYTPWKEFPADGDKRLEIIDEILENYNNLEDKEKIEIDFYNLLRFPKSNIRMCALILFRLKNRKNRWPNEQLLGNEALKIIATEFDSGATDSVTSDVKSNDFGNDAVKLMNTPFLSSLTYGTHKLKGKVVDKTTGIGLKSVCVRLFRTMLRLTKDLNVYSEPDIKSPTVVNKKLPRGDYPVLEIRPQPPNHLIADTVYVRIEFGKNIGWIRSKYNDGKPIHDAIIFDERRYEIRTSDDGSFIFNVNEQLYKIHAVKKDYFDGESPIV